MGKVGDPASERATRQLDIVRFRKIWAMTQSPYDAESKAARRMADRMAEAAGMFLEDAIKLSALPDTKNDDVYVPTPPRRR